ncbi:MAG: hypothetical protein M9948_13000 [Lentimicrobium sp.]|nr:hypothetical protein [Lentimicrobium sp.]
MGAASGQGGNNQWNYNETAAFGMTAAGNISNLIGTAAEYTAYEARALSAAQAARNGINAVKAVSTEQMLGVYNMAQLVMNIKLDMQILILLLT